MRVGVAIPSGTMVHTNFALSLAALMGNVRDHQCLLINSRSSNIAISRNRAVLEAKAAQCDALLFLDTDMSFPADTLERLVRADKDIVGCNYVMRQPPYAALARSLGNAHVQVQGVTQVERLPTGVMLIRMAVFDRLPQPWFRFPVLDNAEIGGEDYWFCDAARQAGFSVWMETDLSLQVVHWGEMGARWTGGGHELLPKI